MEHIVKKSKFLDLFIEVTQTITSCLDLDDQRQLFFSCNDN
ncbi:hypothetical protein [Desulfobacula sp.]